ncbi:acyl-CoA thioesterase [Halomarina oriensis]|uniref:Acyl-CoA thioesterase n=1 Tax=Halomarina oriensis TaxID=671145 RepID=A0A6B0GF29_9EURY|nr:thioesterase family protein [Halomarina oriensis]MWG33432.1 acyl-CoA thioesterase [Halomarina oriensis]
MTFQTTIPVRFRDIDPLGHVNNAVYVTYLEATRTAFYESVLEMSMLDIDTVLAHVEVDFVRPIAGEASVVVDLSVGELGRSSVPMEYVIHDGDSDRPFAAARSVQVFVDVETGTSRPLPDWYREALESASGDS